MQKEEVVSILNPITLEDKVFYEVRFLYRFQAKDFGRLVEMVRRDFGRTSLIFDAKDRMWYADEDCIEFLRQKSWEIAQVTIVEDSKQLEEIRKRKAAENE